MTDDRVLLDRDATTGIARITFNAPERRNAYDPAMRRRLGAHLDDLAEDDDIKVVHLRGSGGVFSTGADMGNAYAWYGDAADPRARRRPSQRRRLSVDRETFAFYHGYLGYPKVTIAEIQGYALGGAFELALMSDISVIAADAKVGMPATRFLGPALGNLHLFFYRLGPVLARRLLLTGDMVEAADLPGAFTETVASADVPDRAAYWAAKVAKMPADGIAIAKEAFRLVEQMQGYQGEEVASYLFHAYGTNLQFGADEFNFVKVRAEHGTKRAFQLRDEHFDVPEPG
ncbi:enoyl-CoA hydratase/carnithine racemase [Actinocorallia herbida]|uniref:Enoyl-CoA hydratase/carnithine racemase n=1 Tax=Actinocorallia herbida TaxID=58109 RepID=A0A3N1CV58_9ACTN|nr:enoyl-CoA hydratase/isomerase family protein [Actinocorallia herbida]ROO85176.1 enoyl-CoA hydratase/carnithine racemase [Actinocorallia herbida]